ncbi:MAG: alpha/beta fold hydrolase [Hamadaea sp.]|nr:alpha/beta fold hydrolase [Hamadaea sp.]
MRQVAAAAGTQPAVYLHGHHGSSQNWTDLAALLSQRLAGVAVDLPGFGLSDPPRSYRVGATAGAVADVIEAGRSGAVHLVGNSFGGTVALDLAARRPDLVRSLTLISPAMPFLQPRWSSELSPRLLRRILGGSGALRRELAAVDAEEYVEAVLARCCVRPSAIGKARLREAIEEVRQAQASPSRLDAEAQSFRALLWELVRAYLPGRTSLLRRARAVRVPTLVVWGDHDRVLDVRLASRVAGLIPHARLAIVRDAGHLPHIEQPGRVAGFLAAFLDDLRAGARSSLATG